MAKTYLETNTVNHNFEDNGFEKTKEALERSSKEDELALLRAYPDEFPFLYAMTKRHPEDDVSFAFREVPADTPDIIPESADVAPRDKRLELCCDLNDGGQFAVSVDPYDRAGEDEPQLRARIDFSQKTLDELNADRFRKIMEFCEQHGLSVWNMSIPYKDGVIDLDEKLATLTQNFSAERAAQNQASTGPAQDADTLDDYQMLAAEIDPVNLEVPMPAKKQKAPKKKKTLDDLRQDLVNMLEKDMHRTKGLTYFEKSQKMSGRKTYIFSLYDKPDPDNPKKDGREDKNGICVPTYQYRLLVSYDEKQDKFYFGIATPGGKKIDDAMAGDFIGIVKGSGATHVNFKNLTNADKGVWLVACAEKGLIPIGIKIDLPKARKMVNAAKEKLTAEELVIFKRRLAEQMVENAREKTKDSGDKTLGLSKSEWAYIESLRAAYDFENFRQAYEDDNGLFALTTAQIDKGSRDEKEGAATTFGGMQTLRTVFDIYNNYQYQNFGDYLNNPPKTGNMVLTADEKKRLSAVIPSDKPMTRLNTADFAAIYETLLPRHIAKAKQEILTALEREDNRKGPKRASSIVLSSDLFPKYKGAVNEINVILTRQKGLDALTLPVEHKGLEFLRPDPAQQNQPATPTNAATNTPQAQGNAPQQQSLQPQSRSNPQAQKPLSDPRAKGGRQDR